MDSEPHPETPAPLLTAAGFLAHWRNLDPAEKLRVAGAAGRAVCSAWRSGRPVDDVPPALWLWDGLTCTPSLPEQAEPAVTAGTPAPARLNLATGLWLWSEWPGFNAVQQRRFLREVAAVADLKPQDQDNLEREAWRALRAEGRDRAAELREDVTAFVAESCRQSVDARGLWRADSSLSATEIRQAVEAALRSPESTAKRSAINAVFRAHLGGFDVAIKRFGPPRRHRRWTYRWRASRARRAWIAGEVFHRLGLVTPRPLGFLEIVRGGRTTESYLITEWLEGRHARAVLDQEPGAASAVAREAFRRAWLGLLWRGVYHADTKLENILVLPGRTGPDRFAWIDLECVHLAGLLTPYRVIRNLVQMNGALPDAIPLRTRLDFLARLPGHWQILRGRLLRRIVAFWTRRRRRREKKRTACSV